MSAVNLSTNQRTVDISGSYNFRDIGGYQIAQGRKVPGGMIYRAIPY